MLFRSSTSTAPRPGVPQGSMVHGLLPSGLAQLERWFPGFTAQAVAAGARPVPPLSIRHYVDGRPKASGSNAAMLTASRPFIEARIRLHTLALPNVKTITAHATGLEFDGDAVTGVRAVSGGTQTIEQADFVVDAMGRSSRLGDWLEQSGWQRPTLRRMSVNVNYATAAFRRDSDEQPFNLVINTRSRHVPSDVYGAAVCQAEDGRWLVMLGSYAEHRPTRTTAELITYCHTELPPEFGQVTANEVAEDVRSYRHPDSRRRDFHLLRRLPARLIAVGDAVASFNPIYGQGMACATLHASCLSEFMRSQPDLTKPATDFFALQKVIVDVAWSTSTGPDLALPHVNGPYPRFYRLRSWISRQIAAAAVHDTDISRRFDEVTYMRKHPASLVTPGVLLRSILVNRRAAKGR